MGISCQTPSQEPYNYIISARYAWSSSLSSPGLDSTAARHAELRHSTVGQARTTIGCVWLGLGLCMSYKRFIYFYLYIYSCIVGYMGYPLLLVKQKQFGAMTNLIIYNFPPPPPPLTLGNQAAGRETPIFINFFLAKGIHGR